MNIALLNHKSDEGATELIRRLDEAVAVIKKENLHVDILVGPDYGLVTREAMKEKRPNTAHEGYAILRQIKSLSKQIPKTTLIPGSMFLHEKTKTYADKAQVIVPMYKNGTLIKTFFKERDADEQNRAKIYGQRLGREIVYERGNSKNNFFELDGKKIALEICADHSNQNAKNSDLELILAYDTNAGFYVNASNDTWSRYALLCDGFKGDTAALHYSSENKKISSVEPLANPNLNLYRIN